MSYRLRCPLSFKSFYGTVQYVQYRCPLCTVRYGTVRYGTVRYGTVRYGTVRYGTVRYGTVQYSTVQYSTVQYSTVQYSTVQYRTGQYSTVQDSTVQVSSVYNVHPSIPGKSRKRTHKAWNNESIVGLENQYVHQGGKGGDLFM
jgi:hypothetical protein